MSYSIIFNTDIIKNEKTEEIALIERAGCNNDNAGRSKYDEREITYFESERQFLDYANGFKGSDYPCKIYGKLKTQSDYGKHLITRYKKATTFDTRKQGKRVFDIYRFDGIETTSPEKKMFKDFTEVRKYFKHGAISYHPVRKEMETESELFENLRKKEHVFAYVW